MIDRPMTRIVKRVTFEASHYLLNDELSSEQNIEVFGACCGLKKGDKTETLETHGHTYVFEAIVAGDADPVTGFVIDFKVLKRLITEEVLNKFDHRCLNVVLPDRNPLTVEVLLEYIYYESNLGNRIVEETGGRAFLRGVRMWETQDSYAEIMG